MATVPRDVLEIVVKQLHHNVLENPCLPDDERDEAWEAFEQLNEILRFQADDGVRMRPATFDVRNHFSIKVENAIARLNPVVALRNPGYLAILRGAAGQIDNRCNATHFRLELLDELNVILDRLTDEAV